MPSVSTYGTTGDPYLDGVLSGIKWGTGSLTFSFPSSGAAYELGYGDNEPLVGFEALNGTQQAAVRAVLASYAAVANLTFTEVSEGAGDLRFGESNQPSTAWAYYPSTSPEGGDVWFNHTNYNNPNKGNYAYDTIIHELGHALGLKHPHEVDGAFGAMPLDKDFTAYTVMSYRSYAGASTSGGYTNGSASYPQSPMMYDIAAVQRLYGANYNTNSGNTTYTWNPTTGAMSVGGIVQSAPSGNKIYLTIWDSNGNDTYDFSNYTTNLTINLAPGQWSTTSITQLATLGAGNVAPGNIANALLFGSDTRSLIENAIGGSGADTMVGNDASNTLDGRGGNDTLTGGSGDDMFVFKAGYGSDSVTDFLAGSGNVDEIDLAGISGLTWDGILARASQVGADTVINFGNGDVLTLKNVSKSNLTAGDFLFQFTSGPHFDFAGGIGDFNGDGKSDILTRQSDGLVRVWGMNGSNIASSNDVSPLPTGWSINSNSDFDGDGKSDLLLRYDASGQIYFWKMNGPQVVSATQVSVLPTQWKIQATDDFTGDGKADVLLRHDSGQIYMWQMNGSQVTSSDQVSVLPNDWHIQGTGDFNGDGKSDILLRHDSGQIYMWQMNGSQVVSSTQVSVLPTAWHIQGTGDFDGDGKDDILLRHDSGQIFLWEMNGAQVKAYGQIAIQPNSLHIENTNDFNGDGRSDILLRDDNGQLRLLEMNGFQIAAANDVSVLTPQWHVVGDHFDLMV